MPSRSPGPGREPSGGKDRSTPESRSGRKRPPYAKNKAEKKGPVRGAPPGSREGPGSPPAGDKPRRDRRRTPPVGEPPPGGSRGRAISERAPNLPKEWVREIDRYAREGAAEAVAGAVSRALTAFAEGNFEVAARAALDAKRDAPRSGMVQEVVGLSAYHLGWWKEALGELMAYRRITGSKDQNHVIADCFRALGRPEKATEICGEVDKSEVPPEVWAETMIVAAGALADRGDLERALRTLARADLDPAVVEPYHLRLWYVRADLLERLGRQEAAHELWGRISAEDPEFFDVQERLEASA